MVFIILPPFWCFLRHDLACTALYYYIFRIFLKLHAFCYLSNYLVHIGHEMDGIVKCILEIRL